MTDREIVLGSEFIEFLKKHGYVEDVEIQSITITAHYDDVAVITVNKHMTKESNNNE